VKNYFRDGLTVLNKNIDLYLIALFFSILTVSIRRIGVRPVETALSLLISPFAISYSLSIPLWIARRKDGRHDDFQTLTRVLLRNIGRLILPAIILFFVAFFAWLSLLFIVVIIFPKGAMVMILSRLVIGIAVLAGMLILGLNFTSAYFSLENDGIIRAALRSLAFSLKNLRFVARVILIQLIILVIFTSAAYITREKTVLPLLSIPIVGYINLWLQTCAVLYFLDEAKPSSNREI
jgi:hypothetical protein